ncbi:MAG: alkane 1-monooxygenase [Acidobacteria bacterium]|nr:alkane 1-monooxygenase [Acidobacteriota bacterium]MCB9397329.1 alkane 1-monooxygenase [Acidobacteriota bacterium]
MKFLAAYFLMALIAAGLIFGSWGIWSGPLVVLMLHPLFDRLVGPEHSSTPSAKGVANSLLWLLLPVEMLLVGYTISAYAHAPIWVCLACGLSLGMITGGIGITGAHELIHRRSAWQRSLGIGLLMLVGYGHFRIEHVYGHHARVATPEDPASAQRGHTLYRFWVRSLIGSFTHAWRLEMKRIQTKKLGWYRHSMIAMGIGQLAIFALAFGLGGIAGGLIWLSQAATAILLLETINYVEHYGLQRKRGTNGRYEPVTPGHSWDCAYQVTNATLFNLGYHSQHHADALSPFQQLALSKESPKLPAGYSLMLILAFFPPLWFRTMHRELDRYALAT